MRLHGPLLLGYGLVIGILLASSAVIVKRARDDMQATIARDAETLSGSLMDEVELAVGDRIATLQVVVGANEPLHAALREANAEFEALGSADAIESRIDAADAQWRETPAESESPLMRSIFDGEASQILRLVMNAHERARGRKVFGELFITNWFGANAGQTGRTSDYRQNDETWWQAAWSAGAWISDEVAFDESAGVHSVDIGLRVDSADGERLGVLKAVLNVEVLRDIIDGFGGHSQLRGAFVALFDSRGHLIHRQDDPTSFGQDLSHEVTVKELLAGRSGSLVDMTVRGEALRAYVTTSGRTPATPRWGLVLNQPVETVFAPLKRLTSWTIRVAVVGTLVAALVGLAFAISLRRVADRLASATDELRSSEEKVRAIVESVVDGIVTADEGGVIESVNPAAALIFGRDADELRGQMLQTLMPEPYKSEHAGYVERYVTTGDAHIIGSQREVVGLRADGSTFPLELAISETAGGGRRRFVGILRDVSAQHEARRTLELAKAAAESAREAAEAASQAKSRFLANMSHELRTPLNAVIGFSEMLVEDLGERSDLEEHVADVQKIRSAGVSLLGLIDEILDLSKIEAGRMDVAHEVFDLNQALTGVVTTVEPLVRAKDIEFQIDVPEHLGETIGDALKLRQVLLNLLSNAAKFTHSGSITLTARRETRDTGDWLTTVVSDTGIGMSPEEVSAIWEAFTQADASTTRKYGGTGLGLTITRRFVEMLNGTIDVESLPGAGTTFTVSVPLIAPEDDIVGTTGEADE